MKEWPKDNEIVSFDELCRPLKEALEHCYTMKRKNRKKDVPYDGYNIGKRERATCLYAKDSLNSDNLKYLEQEHEIPAYEEIIGLAIRLGVEQGRRIQIKGY